MTTRKKTATGKGEAKKLKLKKETIKDLDLKNKARDVKAGLAIRDSTLAYCSNMCTGICTRNCPATTGCPVI